MPAHHATTSLSHPQLNTACAPMAGCALYSMCPNGRQRSGLTRCRCPPDSSGTLRAFGRHRCTAGSRQVEHELRDLTSSLVRQNFGGATLRRVLSTASSGLPWRSLRCHRTCTLAGRGCRCRQLRSGCSPLRCTAVKKGPAAAVVGSYAPWYGTQQLGKPS